MKKFKVVTYNVLSSKLSDPKWFTACHQKNCDPERRFKKLKKMLKSEIDNYNSIICLQEVSRDWVSRLVVYFNTLDYEMITSNYGSRFNGYMGVAIAFPKFYKLNDCKIFRLSDKISYQIRSKRSESNNSLFNRINKNFWKCIYWITSWFNNAEHNNNNNKHVIPLTDYDLALNRHNTMICVNLNNVWFATYHMPCAFKNPGVMNIHGNLAYQSVMKIAQSKPFVLCGDFNLTPNGLQEHTDILKSGDIKSAYLEVLGREPDFTNYAKVQDNPTFIDTLDYIFYSKLKPVAVDELPHRDDILGPLPNNEQPSDHLMLGATFVINK